MNIEIKDKRQEVLFETDNVGKAYSYLETVVPQYHLCTFDTIKTAIMADQQLEINQQRYQFVLNDDKTDCVYMDVEYE